MSASDWSFLENKPKVLQEHLDNARTSRRELPSAANFWIPTQCHNADETTHEPVESDHNTDESSQESLEAHQISELLLRKAHAPENGSCSTDTSNDTSF